VKIEEIKGRGIFVKGDDIDTDRIIPARFMKVLDFSKLGKYAFYDEREKHPNHTFSDARYRGASILVANKNFGCGSSREHAPAALIGFGIRAIIGESFAEIFAGNCIANGIPVVTAKKDDIENLMEVIKDDPASEIKIDLASDRVEYGDFSFGICQKEGHKRCLVGGTWDVIGEMLENKGKVLKIRHGLPYVRRF